MPRVKTHYVDQHILERTVASKKESTFDEHEEDSLNFEDLKPYLDKLPDREVDLIYMYYCDNKKQKEIASYFSISQGAVSHRLTRAKKRLVFLRDMPKVDNKTLRRKLLNVFNEVDAEVMFNMIRTTCQTKTAGIVNKVMGYEGKAQLTQVKVRHKFHRGVDILKKRATEDTSYTTVALLAEYMKEEGPYMLHEVRLPHFEKGNKVEMDMAGAL